MRVDAFGCVNKRRRVGEGKRTENEAEERKRTSIDWNAENRKEQHNLQICSQIGGTLDEHIV